MMQKEDKIKWIDSVIQKIKSGLYVNNSPFSLEEIVKQVKPQKKKFIYENCQFMKIGKIEKFVNFCKNINLRKNLKIS